MAPVSTYRAVTCSAWPRRDGPVTAACQSSRRRSSAGGERGELRGQRQPGGTAPTTSTSAAVTLIAVSFGDRRRPTVDTQPGRGLVARTSTDQNPSATGWLSVITTSANPAAVSWAQ